MRNLIIVLEKLDDNKVEYYVIPEDDQIRITFNTFEDYIVVDEDDNIHANNIQFLNSHQVSDLAKSIAARQFKKSEDKEQLLHEITKAWLDAYGYTVSLDEIYHNELNDKERKFTGYLLEKFNEI